VASLPNLDCTGICDQVGVRAYIVCRSVSKLFCYRSIDERTLVHFADSPAYLLEAYADSGEGLDRAGGFAIQVSQCIAQTYRPNVYT
jgi:septum formation protein